MFTVADVVVVNKIDLLPYLTFDLQAYTGALKGLNDTVEIITVSGTTGQGIESWLSWLENHLNEFNK